MNIIEIMQKQNLSTDSYISNAKNLPCLNSKYNVVIGKRAINNFNSLKQAVVDNNNTARQVEIGFILIGYEREDGQICIETCSPFTQTNSPTEGIDFRDKNETLNKLDEFATIALKFKSFGKPIIFLGHTHPIRQKIEHSNTWSSQDLISAYAYAKQYKTALQMGEMLITPSLDINTLFFEFDEQVSGFYRFPAVYSYDKDSGSYKKENSYGDISAKPVLNLEKI